MSDVMFTAHATVKGGRNGHVKSDDGLIDLNLAQPGESNETGSNPEQLFAAGYSACFDGALNLVADKKKKDIDSEITGDVSLMKDSSDGGLKIGVVLNVTVKGVSQEEAEELVNEAHKVCPYSKATSGNINVELNVKAE
ncbi:MULTISPECIES: organic hydroperoxide resistance protein [Salimicrobium]|uniref:Organic hydroperoxide resistance protein n=3 Tax=Salimicrobium TaxID=351195 RepID=K2GLC6_9BACI|nr:MULTISPECIES: organic hydroperoxide resistance protein [Salimicrobium]AKG05399.1 Organic hydroperoxide resistance protein OhrA [Salimicrobium jeotgali]EKE31139.1 organic hydroperoxide resistance protein [Salimicrobium jeotgali]MBM7697301.1 Ohr subfamily peroxiredoxin [Salimicrobium jeotgali]SDY21934.1 peroxiredoxin, Ohr subfamily [Salimicrobium album]SIS84807.1 peroxiredoxin, Ohr subfamily [Salimicrobium salexigens]